MKTSVRWINDYLDRAADAATQAAALTAAGFNFDGHEVLPDGAVQQEIETTSNRGDCMCHLALARELAAATGRTLKEPSDQPIAKGPATTTLVSVQNQDTTGCPRYTARVIQGVKVGASPEWMQQRLRDVGIVPRNNLVDCTNFVLHEMGQPTHVFDLRKLQGAQICVRRATAGEPFHPIGEQAVAIKLSPADLVIADAHRAVALAGVKGGIETAVDASTVDVLLEAATFLPTQVRQMSRAHQISSDSSKRFERGVHPAAIDAAANRLAFLILQTAGGTLCNGVTEAGAPLPSQRVVSMRPSRCGSLLGLSLSVADMMAPLAALGLSPVHKGDAIHCTIPPQRMDLVREVDLIEEVIRLLGTDRLPVGEFIRIRTATGDHRMTAIERAKDVLAGIGFVECVTHALVAEKVADALLTKGHTALRVEDARAGGAPCLRPAALTGPLASRALNADRGATSGLKLFEIANAFDLSPLGTHNEWTALGMIADAPDASEGFRMLRGVLDRLAHELAGEQLTVQPAADSAGMGPCATVFLKGVSIGQIGLLTTAAANQVGLDLPLAVAEIKLEPLINLFPPERPAIPLPEFPAVDRDISISVDESLAWHMVEKTVMAARLPHLESIAFVGAYRGKQVGAGRKSVTMRLVFRKADGTLRREDVDAAIASLATTMQGSLHAEMRS